MKCKEIEYSCKCEDVNVVVDSTRTGPIILDVLKNSSSSIFVANMEKAKGSQSSTSKSKIAATKVSMKTQARRKPHLKGIMFSESELQQDRDINSVKKRFRTDESTIVDPSEQANIGPAEAIDLMHKDAIVDKGAAGTGKSNQQISDPFVTVTLAGTAQQAYQDK